MRNTRKIFAACALSMSLSGCVSLSEFWDMFGFGAASESVGEPTYHVGDSFTFGSPAITWRVVAVDDERVTWRSDQGDEQVTGRNPLLPALGWKSERLGSGRRIISDQVGSLFPMHVGARMTFKAAVTTDKPPYGWSFGWQCEVLDRQDVVGSTGPLDAFKVGCGRGSLDEIVFFYAPAIGHYVTKTSRSDGEIASRVRHLVAYERIDAQGKLARVEFARVPNFGEPAQAKVIDRPLERFAAAGAEVEADPYTSDARGLAGGLERQAHRLLDRRKEVTQQVAMDRAAPSALEVPDSKAPTTGISVEPESALPRAGGYRLVEVKLPDFAPRPRENPRMIEEAEAVAVAVNPQTARPLVPVVNSVADIPVAATPRPVNPFDVSIVSKAHASPADRTGEIVQKAREKALRTSGMGDEAALAVQSASERNSPIRRSADAKVISGAKPTHGVAVSMESNAREGASSSHMPPSRSATATGGSSSEALAAVGGRQQVASRRELPLDREVRPEEQKFYGVHLGTFLDPRKALLGWQYIFRTHEDLLAGLQPRIRRHDLGEMGVRYKLRVVPFVDGESAQTLCDKLSERGKFCKVSVE